MAALLGLTRGRPALAVPAYTLAALIAAPYLEDFPMLTNDDEIANLALSTMALLSAVNVKKLLLDTAVANASEGARNAKLSMGSAAKSAEEARAILDGFQGYFYGTLAAPVVNVTNLTANTALVEWGPVTGAAGYTVYRGAVKLTPTPVSAFSFQDAGLSPVTPYAWTVRAVSTGGVEGAVSVAAAGVTQAAQLSAPVGVTASNPTGSSMAISWQAVAGADYYNVYRNGGRDNALPVTGTNYIDDGLAPGKGYNWTVRAVNESGESADSVEDFGTTLPLITAPAAPLQPATSGATATTMALKWAAVSGATGYNVYRGTTKLTPVAIAITSFTDSGLTAATPYSWTVKAINSAGEGPASPAATASTTSLANNGLGPRALGGYFPLWPIRELSTIPAAYTHVFLFNAQPWSPTIAPSSNDRDDIGDGTFTIRDMGASHITPAKIKAFMDSGRKLIVSFGGAGAGFNFNTRARSNKFIASVKLILSQLGTNGQPGAHGIDLNTYEYFIRELSKSNPAATANYVTEVVYIFGQLRAHYGPDFILTTPPCADTFRSPNFSPIDGQLAKALSDAGLLTMASPQFYESANVKVANVVKNYTVQWVNLVSGRQSQIGVGMSNHRTYDSMTLDECKREGAAVLALYPNIGGFFGWEIHSDIASGGVWSTAMRALLDSAGGGAPVTPPPTGPSAAAMTNALAYSGGQNGAWLTAAPAQLAQAASTPGVKVAAAGDYVGRWIDKSAGTNDLTCPDSTRGFYRISPSGTLGAVDIYSGMVSTTGGGSGDTGSNGFYSFDALGLNDVYYSILYDDRTAETNGRFYEWNSDNGGFVFSVGTGAGPRTEIRLTNMLDVAYTNKSGNFSLETMQDATNIGVRVNGGSWILKPCAPCVPGSANYGSGPYTDRTRDAIAKRFEHLHTLNPLTAALRDAVWTYGASRIW